MLGWGGVIRIHVSWLGWRDSNPRMHGPKPCALPLGHTPAKARKDIFELLILQPKSRKTHLNITQWPGFDHCCYAL